MDSLGSRIKHARKEAGLSQRKLAQIVECSDSFIALVEKSKSNISGVRLRAVAKALGVRVEWLRTGEGPREPEIEAPRRLTDDERRLLDVYAELPDILRPGVLAGWLAQAEAIIASEAASRRSTPPEQVFSARGAPPATAEELRQVEPELRVIRLVGVIAAGAEGWTMPGGQRLGDEIEVPAELAKGNVVAVEVRGDSMVPTIRPGGVVIVGEDEPRCGELAVIEGHRSPGDEISGWVKRVRRQDDGSVLLESDNPDYAPFRLSADQVKRITRVQAIWHP